MNITARIDGNKAIIYCAACHTTHEHTWPRIGPILPQCPPSTGLWLYDFVWLQPREENHDQQTLF